MKRLGFVGVGAMGGRMVPHLINAGHEVGVVDVGREAVESAVSHGASEASGPAELAATCEIVFTSLPTGAEVDEVYLGEGGLMEAVGEGGLLVDLSTIEPEQSRKLAAEAAERGAVAIDAPVSGGVMGAEAASLTIMVGGPKEAFERRSPFWRCWEKTSSTSGGTARGRSRNSATISSRASPWWRLRRRSPWARRRAWIPKFSTR